jgi:hypothetical protein
MFNLFIGKGIIYMCVLTIKIFMEYKTTIYYHTHGQMRLDKRVQSYVFHAGFLYVSCLNHIKFDHSLIHALIKTLFV